MKIIKKILKFLGWSIVIFTLFIILIIYISFIYLPDKNYIEAKNEGPYDAIIVPGVPFKDDWSDIMKARVLWAEYLYKKGIAKNIIFSGSAVYSPFVEAKIMALYAEKLGVPALNIFTETRAEHSTENLYYSYHLAKKAGFAKIALATDPFQNLMLSNFKNSLDPAIGRIPVVFRIIKELPERAISIDPTSAEIKQFTSLVKRESFWERFKGTLGRKIKKEAD